MVPSWMINTLIVVLGCIVAVFLGATLPEYDYLGAYLLGVSIIGTFCAITNNFPALLAFGIWFPLPPIVPFFSHFPTIALLLMWIGCILFFRICVSQKLKYVPSCNLFLLLCFLWVPIRFMLNPIHKLGGSVLGGHGVSGANAYFLYVVAGALLVSLGAILNTREKLINYMRWAFRWCFFYGIALLICACIPATWPILISLGMYAAGTMTEGIMRLVVLPGYGLYLVSAAICPTLFRLTTTQAIFVFLLGLTMIIVGGNRSTMAAAMIMIPFIFFMLRRSHALMLSMIMFLMGLGVLHLTVDRMDKSEIPMFARCFGMLDPKIDEATGGSGSANWRYAVWQSGLEKIRESPLIGKGFGNLPQRVDINQIAGLNPTTDFEVVLAAGEAHNGYITAAYGFGIPFALVLAGCLLWRIFSHMRSALTTSRKDLELREFHALLAANVASAVLLTYCGGDMSDDLLWVIVGMGIILDHVTRRSPKPVKIPLASSESQSKESPQLVLNPSQNPNHGFIKSAQISDME